MVYLVFNHEFLFTKKDIIMEKTKNQYDIRTDITNKIIESLKKGIRPWIRPWSGGDDGLPVNVVSKKMYRGINVLLLQLTSLERGYKSKYWGTFEQWKSLGGQVRKRPPEFKSGDWGTHIVFYNTIEKDEPTSDGGTKKKKIFFLRGYTVFNVEQVDGDKLDKYRVNPPDPTIVTEPNWEPAEKVIAATDAKIEFGGNRAYYMRPTPDKSWPNHTGGDFIRMPTKAQFTELSEFYMVQFHELAHYMEVRLGWDGSYAQNELIAEITGCYLATETGVPNLNMDNHNKYLATWLKEMESDPKWIFHASTQASKVSDYILSFSRESDTESESEECDFLP